MKRIPLVVVLLVLSVFVNGQISMETNLPSVLPLNSDLVFDVKIRKGALTNFSKYQMEVSKDMVITCEDCQSGSFTFEDNVVKIIWVMTPTEPEINLKLKLNSGLLVGNRVLTQKYFYIENDDKRQVEMENIVIAVKDSASLQAATVATYTLAPKMPASLVTTTINVNEISTKRPEVLIQQVAQLRRDAKDANEVGEREKKEAELKITTANEAITAAAAISSDEERKTALEKANSDKQKGEKDLEIAERVLVLAKSLEDNANEIEKINKEVNPGSFSGKPAGPTIAAANKPNASGESSTTTTVNIDNLDSVFGPPETKGKEKSKKSSETTSSETESGMIYKIQVGAFSKKPSKSDFKAIGKVKIQEENGMHKVLYGAYKSKEEALKERQSIISKGFDGFVVTYLDGVRQK